MGAIPGGCELKAEREADRPPGGFTRTARYLLVVAAALVSLHVWTLHAIHFLFLACIVFVAGIPVGVAAGLGRFPLGTRGTAWATVTAWLGLMAGLLLQTQQLLASGNTVVTDGFFRLLLILPASVGHFLAFYSGLYAGCVWVERLLEPGTNRAQHQDKRDVS